MSREHAMAIWQAAVDAVRPEPLVKHQHLLIKTVHGVKGETHHTTILFVPEVPAAECPSEAWWEDDEPVRVAVIGKA